MYGSCLAARRSKLVGAWYVQHVPDVSLTRIFDDAPVAYLTPPSWCTVEGAVLVDPGGDLSGMVCLLVFIHPSPGRTRGRLVYRGTLPLIWPFSSNYEDMHPVMPC